MCVHANMCMHLTQEAGLSHHCMRGLGGLARSAAVWACADGGSPLALLCSSCLPEVQAWLNIQYCGKSIWEVLQTFREGFCLGH